MKEKMFSQLFIFTIVIAFLIFYSCDKNSNSNPVSYIDGYQPDYTEAKGTSHTGTYFPVTEGLMRYYTGWMDGYITTKLNGTYGGQKIDESFADSLSSYECFLYTRILAPVPVLLSGQTYSLFPEEQVANLGLDEPTYFEEIIRYYEIDTEDSTVYIRAVPYDGDVVEVKDPVFVKPTLIVGDSWSSYPTINTSNYVSGGTETIDMKAKCKIFVVGKDSLTMSGTTESGMIYEQTFYAIQLDEVAEISATIKIQSGDLGDMDMELSGKILVHLYLAEDVGIVKTKEHVEFLMKGTISDSHGSVNIDISINVDDELMLDPTIPPAYTPKVKPKILSNKFPEKIPVDLENIIQQAIELIKIIKL